MKKDGNKYKRVLSSFIRQRPFRTIDNNNQRCPDGDRHRKHKMAAAKPAVVLCCILEQMEAICSRIQYITTSDIAEIPTTIPRFSGSPNSTKSRPTCPNISSTPTSKPEEDYIIPILRSRCLLALASPSRWATSQIWVAYIAVGVSTLSVPEHKIQVLPVRPY